MKTSPAAAADDEEDDGGHRETVAVPLMYGLMGRRGYDFGVS